MNISHAFCKKVISYFKYKCNKYELNVSLELKWIAKWNLLNAIIKEKVLVSLWRQQKAANYSLWYISNINLNVSCKSDVENNKSWPMKI